MKIIDKGKAQGTVYHYTSFAAALSIITPEGLKFHASRYDNMRDSYDSEYAFAIAQDILEKNSIDFIDMDDYNCRPYVLSFCKTKDDFSMRRLYNAEIILHIDSEKLLQEGKEKSELVRGDDVLYLHESQTTQFVLNAFDHYFRLTGEREDLNFEAKAKCSFLKHPTYAVENEWRFAFFEDYDLTNGDRKESLFADSNNFVSEIKSKVVNGSIRIFREMTFDQKCLTGITLFEHDQAEIIKLRDILNTWLVKCGYEHHEIPITLTQTPKINK